MNELDLKVIEGCVSEDRTFQKKLFNDCYGKCMPIAMRYSSSVESANKLISTGFLRVLSEINKAKKEESLFDWVFNTIKDVCIENLIIEIDKSVKLFKLPSIYNFREEIEFDLSNISPNDIIMEIQKLESTHRLVFNLYVFDNFTINEISQLLKINEDDVDLILKFSKHILKYNLENLSKSIC